uniref:Uncharacterized protein n=1 Tax=Lepeophtheirus salmonis TaxID=72036 RepID=A0A0K2T6H5_LEPSM
MSLHLDTFECQKMSPIWFYISPYYFSYRGSSGTRNSKTWCKIEHS